MATWVAIIFVLGYLLIACEHRTKVNKAAVALLAAVLCWTVYILFGTEATRDVVTRLTAHVGDIAGILFFLLGAMTIVELIDAHHGFNIVTACMRQTNKRQLLWIVGLLTFFLASVLDNLTTAIVVISILRKLIADEEDRLLYAGVVVIAANAGAWTPIGAVTTTMLWIGGQVTTKGIILATGLPCLVCLAVAVGLASLQLKGNVLQPVAPRDATGPSARGSQVGILVLGMLALVSVPAFNTVTHLPPFMGMLAALGTMWAITEVMHRHRDEAERYAYSVAHALRKIDTTVVLFFLGILLSVAALQSAGILDRLGAWMATHIGNDRLIVVTLGLLSAVVDNVPLTAAVQGMYGLAQYPVDHEFWCLLAYCVGTGGSVLIIGSAAGVAAMGMERLTFWWYFRRMAWIALCAYLAGVLAFVVQSALIAG
jgi:Na+/H+ antiporter NhaD/arsenite permease-like protein